MKRKLLACVAMLSGAFTLAANAETTVKLSDTHICCNSCVTNVANVMKGFATSNAVADRDAKSITITAPDAATAQKVVDAMVVAGYYGASSDSAIKVSAPNGAADGKVTKLEVSGVHLCCGNCVTAVKNVLTKVPGIETNTVAAKAETFTLTGNFDAKQLFTELNKAGLAGHVAVPKPAAAN
jgi:copper chaperone CopZ